MTSSRLKLVLSLILCQGTLHALAGECLERTRAQISLTKIQNKFGEEVLPGNDSTASASRSTDTCHEVTLGGARLEKFQKLEHGASLGVATRVASGVFGGLEFWQSTSEPRILPYQSLNFILSGYPSQNVEWFGGAVWKKFSDSKSLSLSVGTNVAVVDHVWLGTTAYVGKTRFRESTSTASFDAFIARTKYMWDSGTAMELFGSRGIEPSYDSAKESQSIATHHSFGLRYRLHFSNNLFSEISVSNDIIKDQDASEQRLAVGAGGWW